MKARPVDHKSNAVPIALLRHLSPRWSQKKGRKTVVMVILIEDLVMVALCNRADHYIFILFLLLLLSSSFFSSPNLSGRRLDVYHTLAHGVANLECRSEMCCTRLAANTGRKKSRQKSPSRHHRTTLSGHIFATKAYIDNRKKLVKQQYLHYMS